MTTHRLLLAFASLLLANVATADTTTLILAPGTGQAITIAVPAGTRSLTLNAAVEGVSRGQLELYVRPALNAADAGFNVSGDLPGQAQYHAAAAAGKAHLTIIDRQHPALQQGTWYAALANHGSSPAHVTLQTAIVTTAAASLIANKTVFQINFEQPSAAVIDKLTGSDPSKLDCDTAPWHDQTPLDSDGDGETDTTLGAFRRSLLQQAANHLSTQVHTPIPVKVQACWKAFGDKDDAKSYTLAAAGATYIFYGVGGGAPDDTWYATAPTERLAGAPMCQLDSSIPCDMPDIVVRYNSDKVAQKAYDDAADEPLIISTTMHEITHGLGFLSQVNTGDPDKYKDDLTKDPGFGDLYKGKHDAYTNLVAYANNGTVKSYNVLTKTERTAALTSGTGLVLDDLDIAANLANSQHARPFPANLVQLYAPTTVESGSTLSHFNDDTHPGQLMDHFIQHNYPTTLGLAQQVLEQVGWSTGPTPAPIAGAWYDPAHSGHGIDLEPVTRDPAGDLYQVIFYTFDDSGESAYFYSYGRLRNGHYESADVAGQPALMGRPVYDPVAKKATFPDTTGRLSIDFTNYAAADPACAEHSGPNLALMHWTINGSSATWCIGALLSAGERPPAATDLNGLWYGGPGDSGWGMSVVNMAGDNTAILNPILLYYYDSNNKSHWAEAAYGDYQAGTTTPLYALDGYCRQCGKPPAGLPPPTEIGTLTLNLNMPNNTSPPSHANTLSFKINGAMQRTNTPITMNNLLPGQ